MLWRGLTFDVAHAFHLYFRSALQATTQKLANSLLPYILEFLKTCLRAHCQKPLIMLDFMFYMSKKSSPSPLMCLSFHCHLYIACREWQAELTQQSSHSLCCKPQRRSLYFSMNIYLIKTAVKPGEGSWSRLPQISTVTHTLCSFLLVLSEDFMICLLEYTF